MEFVAAAFMLAATVSTAIAYLNRKQNEKTNEYIRLQRAKEREGRCL